MFQPNRTDGGVAQVRQGAVVEGAYLTQAFFWMFAGLLLTAAVSAAVLLSPPLYRFAVNNVLFVIIAQLALVMVISFGIRRLSASAALGLFFVYAASLGLDCNSHSGANSKLGSCGRAYPSIKPTTSECQAGRCAATIPRPATPGPTSKPRPMRPPPALVRGRTPRRSHLSS